MSVIHNIERTEEINTSSKDIRINQYYPTELSELFNIESIKQSTKDKWDSYLSSFEIGKLKGYIWLQLRDFLCTGWKYLFYRELAYRKDSLENIKAVHIETITPYNLFSWIIWSDSWIYLGIEQENNYSVCSIPKDKINVND